MRSAPLPCLLTVAIAFAACGQPDEATRARIDGVERRLDALEQRLAAVAKEIAGEERVREELRALEQRVGAAEAKATQALETARTAPPPAPAAAGRPQGGGATPEAPARPDARERRAQLDALGTEYRRRLAEADARLGPDASVTDRIAARRTVRDWYLARRRAILTGQPLPE
jgi:hypothetical protein